MFRKKLSIGRSVHNSSHECWPTTVRNNAYARVYTTGCSMNQRLIHICGAKWPAMKQGVTALSSPLNRKHAFRITKTKKFRSQALADKVMPTTFSDHKGLLLVDILSSLMLTSLQTTTETHWTSCIEPLRISDPACLRLA